MYLRLDCGWLKVTWGTSECSDLITHAAVMNREAFVCQAGSEAQAGSFTLAEMRTEQFASQ